MTLQWDNEPPPLFGVLIAEQFDWEDYEYQPVGFCHSVDAIELAQSFFLRQDWERRMSQPPHTDQFVFWAPPRVGAPMTAHVIHFVPDPTPTPKPDPPQPE